MAALVLPSSPGVYWFVGENDEVLYVGKAKNIKNRIANYRQTNQLVSRIKQMVFQARELKFQVLESELEALLIEAELIRTHQPPYNVLLKDDKTPLYILITDEKFSRVLTVRKREVQKKIAKGTLLGPFPNSAKIKEVLRLARQIFPWCSDPQGPKPCFYYHLQLCQGACIGKISPEEYQINIQNLITFLRGKKKDVLRKLELEMKEKAIKEEYEKAGQLRDSISIVKAVTQSHYQLQPNTVLPALKINAAEESIIQLRQLISTYLDLPKNYPLSRIEGYDVSNIQGTNATVAMVVFTNGQADKAEYRLFNIKTVHQPNDYAMLQEALQRRQNHPEWGEPDLILIDGGKGQLRAVKSVWQWATPVISLAKKPDRIIIPSRSLQLSDPTKKTDFFGIPKYHELQLSEQHYALRLLQQVRDEAHRFSKQQHTRLRTKDMFK